MAIGYMYAMKTETLGARIRRARKAAQLTQIQLSAAVRRLGGDLSQSQLSAIEKDEVERPGSIVELARALGLTAEQLLGDTPPQQDSLFATARVIAATTPQTPPVVHHQIAADVPVWASVAAGNGDGEMLLTDTPIDYIRRSDPIMNAVDPFAFYIVGDSMEERLYQGDQVVVNRSLPLRPGDECVFISQGEDGQLRGLVKRLMRSTADAWKVRQLNPRKDFDLPKRLWTKAYRIVEIRPRS